MDARLHDLSIDEKLQLVEDLWDSIAADQHALPLAESDRDEFEADGDVGRDATRVLDEIQQRL